MNHSRILRFIVLLLLIIVGGVCVADNTLSFTAYIQGGEGSIANGINGTYVITAKDVVPYFYLTKGEGKVLSQVEKLSNLTFPQNAALVFSSGGNHTTVMVQVTNMSLSDGNNVITIQANPLEFYEGEQLKLFKDKNKGLETLSGFQFSTVAITYELIENPPQNEPNDYCGCCCGCTQWHFGGGCEFCYNECND